MFACRLALVSQSGWRALPREGQVCPSERETQGPGARGVWQYGAQEREGDRDGERRRGGDAEPREASEAERRRSSSWWLPLRLRSGLAD